MSVYFGKTREKTNDFKKYSHQILKRIKRMKGIV